jgi:hypothetical protein
MHRFILGLTDRKVEVDHINGIGTDNRRCNLRVTDRAGNARNCRRRVDNVSGYKGVYKDERNRFRPWIAQIKFKKKKYRLGYFATPQEAHKAYCEAAQKMHAEFANLGV